MVNIYADILQLVMQEDRNGYGITVLDVSKKFECDAETARRRLKEMTAKGMIELDKTPTRHMWKLPGHKVGLKEAYTHYVSHKNEPRMTVEKLAAFMETVKPGMVVEYASEYIGEKGYKFVRVKKAHVVKVFPHLVLLDNGHTCLAIELWWYVTQKRIVGTSPWEKFRRIYG